MTTGQAALKTIEWLTDPRIIQGILTLSAAVYAGHVALRIAEHVYPLQKSIDRRNAELVEKRKLFSEFLGIVEDFMLIKKAYLSPDILARLHTQMGRIELVAGKPVIIATTQVVIATSEWFNERISSSDPDDGSNKAGFRNILDKRQALVSLMKVEIASDESQLVKQSN